MRGVENTGDIYIGSSTCKLPWEHPILNAKYPLVRLFLVRFHFELDYIFLFHTSFSEFIGWIDRPNND